MKINFNITIATILLIAIIIQAISGIKYQIEGNELGQIKSIAWIIFNYMVMKNILDELNN